jgi:tetratricopeptide (TPR) repeat protein
LPDARRLEEAAKRAIVPVYATVAKPEKAHVCFVGLVGEPEVAAVILARLGRAYEETGQHDRAAILYRDLLVKDPTRACEHQLGVARSVAAMGAKEPALEEVGRALEGSRAIAKKRRDSSSSAIADDLRGAPR